MNHKSIWVLGSPESLSTDVLRTLHQRFAFKYFSRQSELLQALDESKGRKLPLALILELELFDFTQQQLKAPFFFISSSSSLSAIHRCFDAGAHDCFVRPFDENLFVAKIERLFRKPCGAEIDLILDPVGLTAKNMAGQMTTFTVKEFRILSALLKTHPEAVSRQELFQTVWGDVKVVKKALDVHLFRMRRKLEALGWKVQCGRDLHFSLLRSSDSTD